MSGPGRVTELGTFGGAKVALLSNFDVGQSILKKQHTDWLDASALTLLRAGGSATLLGFTSTTGREVYNQQLSDDRTKAVLVHLEAQSQKQFQIKVDARHGYGEAPARLIGLPDDVEASNWRAVLVSVWTQPTPPPFPNVEPPPACRRTVMASDHGVNYWTTLPDGSNKG